MKREKPILQILANRNGVYEVDVRALATDYETADHLSAAIRPAIAIIDKAIDEIYRKATKKSAEPSRGNGRLIRADIRTGPFRRSRGGYRR
jgi:hypothetical protein